MDLAAKPKLEDVARLAGVSTATVSRCLNAPERVTGATRERVLQAVDELGYTPDFVGRALASKRTNTVGAVIPTMENAIFARGLQAFQEVLAESGVTLLVASSGYDEVREAEQIRSLVARGADGILLIGAARPETSHDYLRRLSIPFVQAWSIGAADTCSVGFDNAEAAQALAMKVLEAGHRKVAMIAGITHMNDRAARRVDGVRSALAAHGIDPASLLLVETRYVLEDARRAAGTILAQNPDVTALVCGNDVIAVGAMTEARARGLRVPDDISVTGFDDIDLAEIVEPGLTTVHVPHRRMGAAAARALLALIDGTPTRTTQIIETSITMRGSLAPPPQR